MNDEDEPNSLDQEGYLLKSLPGVHRFISRKLGAAHRSAVEDVKQKVFLKLWRWKKDRQQVAGDAGSSSNRSNSSSSNSSNSSYNPKENNLTDEEWQKMAYTVARNEVIDFFREKYTRRDVVFSQMDEKTKETVFSTVSDAQTLEGNSRAELCSQMILVWKAAKVLSIRQKYTYFLHFRDFIIEFILCRCCSIEELAEYFQTDEKGLAEIIKNLPFRDEEIGRLYKLTFGDTLSPKQIWEARAKGKVKLAKKLSEYISDERLFVQRGT